MNYVANAAAVWIAPTGVLPGALLFELVPAGSGWMIICGVLAAVCSLLLIVTDAGRLIGPRWRLRIPRAGAKRRQPLHA